ncbi:hypothetical protein PI124_g10790 [Phytophthora idaei]|nr:hypothetical protein PI125_g8413 [Phytophthora idaei]KAG3156617.1 hypothetical protein PI126_g8694 [Phytophthora idaei]KAG3244452.1 hypothetical protein PI124_g10790 [Phytophthora idaei]
MIVKQEVKLDPCFDTTNGALTLKNVTCWVVSGGLPPGMGDILLGEGIMVRLGYSAQNLLDQARLVADVYDMDEPATMGDMCGVLSYATTTTEPTQTPEEEELRPKESQSCFPEVDIHQDREEARALEWSILEEKLEEATTLGCSECFS